MAETTNYGLYIEDDDSVTFKSWREKMNGTDENSNMVKIDKVLKQIADSGIATIKTVESSESGGDNLVVITLTTGETAEFTVKNGTIGRDGKSVTGISYNSSTNKWVIAFDDNGETSSVSINGPVLPEKVTDLSDGSNYYTSEKIDEMFGSYVADIAAIIGGDA